MHFMDERPGAILSFKTFLFFINRLLVTIMAPHSSTLAWMVEPGRLQSMGLLRVYESATTEQHHFHFHVLEKEMASHFSILA